MNKVREEDQAIFPGSREAVYEFLDPCDKENTDVIDTVLEAAEEAGLEGEYIGACHEVKARYDELRAIVEAEYARRRDEDESGS